MRRLLGTIAVIGVAAAASGALGSVLASDDFSYVGALTDNGWVAHSGAGNKVIMSDGSVATLDQSGGSGEDDNLGFTTQGAADTTWAAFDLNLPSSLNDPNALGLLDTNGLYFAHFKDSGFAFRARTGVVVPSGGGDYGLAINADNSDLGSGTTWGSDLSFDTTYRIVINWNAGTGESRLWVDPASEASTSISHTGTFVGDLMEGFALRQSNDYTGGMTIDNVYIGMSFSDVAVPEPASLLLLGLGGLALLRRR